MGIVATCPFPKIRTPAVLLAALLSAPTAPISSQAVMLSAPVTLYSDTDGLLTLDRRIRVGPASNGSLFLLESKGGALHELPRGARQFRQVTPKGSGPGEYVKTLSFGWISDTLWFSDTGTQRVTRIASWGRGKPISEAFTGARNRTFMTGLPFALPAADRAVVGAIALDQRLTQSNLIQRLPVLLTTRNGARTIDTLFHLDVRNGSLTIDLGTEGGRIVQQQPLGDGTLWAESRNGRFVAMVERAGQVQTTLLESSGKQVYRVVSPVAPEPLDTKEGLAVADRQLQDLNEALRRLKSPPVSSSDFRRNLYLPRYRPAVLDVLVGDDGSVVLRGNDWSRRAVSYTILAPRGTLRATLEVPANQYIRAIAADTIWSVVEGQDGDFSLVRQTLRKR